MKPLLISSGEPAGVGPDLCLALAGHPYPVVILSDKTILRKRADLLGLEINFYDYTSSHSILSGPKDLAVLDMPCTQSVVPGVLDVKNASYVLKMLSLAIDQCLEGKFSGLVTAPVHKGIINEAGIFFTGHTEFLAERCKASNVVMMLACDAMKVALVTTHLPLKQVAKTITTPLIVKVIEILHHSLKFDFNMQAPIIKVAGLNPHAGEGGHLGKEELDVIIPAIKQLLRQGIKVEGPLAADTMFVSSHNTTETVFVAMYHDQGLPVLKYAGFGKAVNVTLGLPIIRTSVDHGTALELAGTGKASPESLIAATKMASQMVQAKHKVMY